MDPVKRFEFVTNSMYAFRVGLDSYHGFDGGSYIGKSNSSPPAPHINESRDSIILIFKRTSGLL